MAKVAIKSHVPWWLPDSDLTEAHEGEPDFERTIVKGTHHEQHLGLMVTGQFDPSMVLGMIAIRSKRSRDSDGRVVVEPLTIAIPETPFVVATPRKKATPSMDVTLLSGTPRSVQRPDIDYGDCDPPGALDA